MSELMKIYELLNKRYGNLNWWPADSPYEVMVGAVLTQNTNWGNVEKALANFANFGKTLAPELIEAMPTEELIDVIRPAGFFNQKAVYLKAVTAWFKNYGYDIDKVKSGNLKSLRKELLAVKGVGKETADSILLYAFNFPTFVIDAYTRRLLERLGFEVPKEYDDIKALFEEELPHDEKLRNNYHACIVINAKEHCKVKPICTDCPLVKKCAYGKNNGEIVI